MSDNSYIKQEDLSLFRLLQNIEASVNDYNTRAHRLEAKREEMGMLLRFNKIPKLILKSKNT